MKMMIRSQLQWRPTPRKGKCPLHQANQKREILKQTFSIGRKKQQQSIDSKIKAMERKSTTWENVADMCRCKKEKVEMTEQGNY